MCRTSGAPDFWGNAFPALTDRANLCRASGAGWSVMRELAMCGAECGLVNLGLAV